ncbi:LOW QUALITY PROTEIN: plasma protease C1 inhibitor [Melospiza melodia melodia]|uniref:LOW QUALITY PROTEIN: plasma protease C1 inhibitor n=1 Tax=Melospiza melodia melodia TaxID=1914991 RepID=UPI002FD6AFFB
MGRVYLPGTLLGTGPEFWTHPWAGPPRRGNETETCRGVCHPAPETLHPGGVGSEPARSPAPLDTQGPTRRAPSMAIKTLWLPLAWLVATATVTVTPVLALEAPSSWTPLFGEPPTPPVPPARTPAPSQDVGTPSAHPEGLPGWDAPSPTATEGALEELDPIGTTAVPPPGTSAPPCPGDEEPPDACGEPTGEQRAAVAEALGTFALRFYQRMAEEAGPDANLLFSPITVATGLSHLLLGARGETQERLAALLAYPPGLHCVHGALQQLASTPGLFSAAQIFPTQVRRAPELQLRPRFLNDSLRFYGARPHALSGNESLDLQRINAWVREASKGLLPSLLSALPPEPSLLLLSAVHLRAAWRTPLDRKKTVLLPFLRPGQAPRKVPTMTSAKYPVASFSDSRLRAQVGRLELHGGLSLVVLMPREPLEPLESLERALDPATFLALLRRAARTPPRATALSLPRLRLDLALDVVPLLHDMDFGLFLDAELCGLARGPAAVDTARHRAVLALDEAGVEAAAAMATSVARSALVLEALRPFLFVLWHNSGDFPVFMGRLSDPQP